ncbi:AAA family ATPase [Streptomyces sp. enrichment culture]|uniref:helix-turn-helix transcriptional regulator n=1 Tax=Streptomyces sp. enrichment culture TaxID=1795815 RepID=UPI003F579176
MHVPHDEDLPVSYTAGESADPDRFRDSPLTGREPELRVLDRFLTRAGQAGYVLVLSGDLGVGRTALVRATVGAARRGGFTAVEITGHESEADVRGAGLAQVLAQLGGPSDQRADSKQDDGFASLVVAATQGPEAAGLALLGALTAACGGDGPLLLALDDAQWFDTGSLDALLFAMRHMANRPVGLLVSTRSDDRRAYTDRFPLLTLGPLDATASEQLLHQREQYLPPPLAKRVLAETEGYPAGIVGVVDELKRAGTPASYLLAPRLPLGEALQRRVSPLLADVPDRARAFMLLAAQARTDRLDILVKAAEVSGADRSGLTTAEAAGLIDISGARLRFTHPLLQSVLHWTSSFDERKRANVALAELLTDDPYRRALHIAALSSAPDETTASALEEGVTADLPEAAAVLELAAELSPASGERARRLVKAAQAAAARGHVRGMRRLLGRLTATPVPPALVADATALEARVAYNKDGTPGLATTLLLRSASADSSDWPPPFVPVACSMAPALCVPAAGGALRPKLEELLRQPGRADDANLLSALSWVNPVAYGPRARAVLDRAVAEARTGAPPADVARAVALVIMTTGLDDPVATDLIGNQVLGPLVTQGHFGTAITVLIHLQIAHVNLGDRAAVEHDAEVGDYWARSSEDDRALMAFRSGIAQTRAWRGNDNGHDTFTDEILAYALPRRLQMLAARTRWSRGLMSLADGRPEEAFEELSLMSRTDGDAWDPIVAGWALGDLVAAAAASGRGDEVQADVERVEHVGRHTGSALLAHLVARSYAMLSDGEVAERHFTAALEPTSAPMRFERARTHLAFGEWLRRQRRVLEARTHLQQAHDSFDALGADAWSQRAASELLAAGEAPASGHPAWAEQFGLTPREAEVARLAAAGLTNQRIGWQLGLTHRTVASHLSRIFLKVGVQSRRQLPSVLQP